MQEVTFTLRTITPLFMAGADQTKAELRAPTFRGLMRYWYRALVGGIVGANERALPQIIAAESALFGATDTGSAITVQVSEASKSPQRYQKESYSRASTSGKDYMLWSMAESGRENQRDTNLIASSFHKTQRFKLLCRVVKMTIRNCTERLPPSGC